MVERTEKAVFTNMVMIEDGDGRVLVQRKLSEDWGGLVFPGGHVEAGEFFTDAAVREVKEETGLTVISPRLVGIKHFITKEYRYVVTMFFANRFHGELTSSREGEVAWMTKEELLSRRAEMPRTFLQMLDIFFHHAGTEYCMMENKSSPYGWDEELK